MEIARGNAETVAAESLTPAMLAKAEVTAEGGKILDGQGTLSKLDALESRVFSVVYADDLIVPNPKQPRKYFDPTKMEELKGTLKDMGQTAPIICVPIIDASGKRKLFIVDGERRFRAMQELGWTHAKVEIIWAASEQEIFYRSLILNTSKADHNPIELAEAYQCAIEFEQAAGVTASKAVVAEKIGIAPQKLLYFLRLLELPDPVKDVIRKGDIRSVQAYQIRSAIAKYGDQIDAMRLAALLVEKIRAGKFDDAADKRGKTARAVRAAVEETLLAGGAQGQAAARELEAGTAVFAVVAQVSRIIRACERILGADRETVLNLLRNRGQGQPPEVLRDGIRQAIEQCTQALALLEEAVKPPPLDIPAGKPKFGEFLKRQSSGFRAPLRYNMARALASASDDGGKCLTVAMLVVTCNTEESRVAGNMPLLRGELAALGLELQEFTFREKDSHGSYDKKMQYRLGWKKPAEDSEPADKVALPGALSDPPAAIASRMTAAASVAMAGMAAAKPAAPVPEPSASYDDADADDDEAPPPVRDGRHTPGVVARINDAHRPPTPRPTMPPDRASQPVPVDGRVYKGDRFTKSRPTPPMFPPPAPTRPAPTPMPTAQPQRPAHTLALAPAEKAPAPKEILPPPPDDVKLFAYIRTDQVKPYIRNDTRMLVAATLAQASDSGRALSLQQIANGLGTKDNLRQALSALEGELKRVGLAVKRSMIGNEYVYSIIRKELQTNKGAVGTGNSIKIEGTQSEIMSAAAEAAVAFFMEKAPNHTYRPSQGSTGPVFKFSWATDRLLRIRSNIMIEGTAFRGFFYNEREALVAILKQVLKQGGKETLIIDMLDL